MLHADSPAQKNSASLAERTQGMQHMPGLLSLDWDAKTGKLYLEVPLDGNAAHTRSQDLIYTNSTPWSMGSSQLGGYGMDRGQIAPGEIVHFERTGPKLLLVEPNLKFRSSSSEEAEEASVAESFPVSVLAGFTIDAESADSTVLVDATQFFLTDAHHVAEGLAEDKQGSYHVDPARSTIVLDDTKAFPKNTVVEAELTFVTGQDTPPSGRIVEEVAPNPRAVTVRERQIFVQLPPPGYTPRRFSPRAGYFPTGYRDYDAALSEPLEQQFIVRHRLIKKDPKCTHACEAVAPIQYYVDRGAPEPMRSALVRRRALVGSGISGRRMGARDVSRGCAARWRRPDGRALQHHPVGASLHARVELRRRDCRSAHRRNSERKRDAGQPARPAGLSDCRSAAVAISAGKPPADEAQMRCRWCCQRIRQLGAHETGHTLGLAHNFAASSFPHAGPDRFGDGLSASVGDGWRG